MADRAAFGLELRRAREDRGLGLDVVAARTKVSAAYFAGLERGDVSRWPSGIFRRAFVRSYAAAVGLDPDEIVGRFVRLFPDAGDDVDVPAAAPERLSRPAVMPGVADAPRLVLAEPGPAASSTRLPRAVRRATVAIVDLAVFGLPAAVVALAVSWVSFWALAGCVAAIGHVLFFTAFGTTPGGRLLRSWTRLAGPSGVSEPPRHRVPGPAPVQVVARRLPARHVPVRPVPRARMTWH